MSEEMRKARFSAELQEEIVAYLATGDSHHTSRGVPGDLMQAMRIYDEHLRSALLAEGSFGKPAPRKRCYRPISTS